ncbi:phospho-N-acetylmuramoyl-pentapeptide-transferase [Candidatus Uhrbacteria bacterium RIFOXYA2_FULL_40_9]|nr:MAG: Phospho-N-acetylmuramoyl-pentapeptide-transferase [Candidatus Uhrbacteria bacterium GW2011_GWF2_40_263]OGL94301.1 MAG: phospho-N-acetylmuramoyl-pentapeptide-transferase [Candidatus Uhrbacteria bacterium RIFOXYA2_FULL_40_9]OGL96522.1 MAG: phospho-N-acetylmuramoyl-pentapeptide-transferase [Candidatus Uhrbacteria bacterium RIFOXYB2_FULL_41_18]HBK35047.1 phospho-N-acetylmuramoyl-pentapeptide-transferase [Candidatus Uhrbacteria bacterium]HCB55592.1 phospho-N-acetylmuramoyl-pentapeptide-trans
MTLESLEITRVLVLTFIAFLLAIAWTPYLIRILKKFKMGKSIRTEKEAPIFAKLHAKKAGIPTMGGLLIWITVLFLAVVFYYAFSAFPEGSFWAQLNFLSRGETLLPLGALVASAIVGFVDDYFNVKGIGKGGGGLRVRHRLFIYTAIALVGAYWFHIKLDWDLLHIPFLGDYNIGFWYLPFFLLVIVSTAFSVNESDGLDGLAGGALMTSFGAYVLIAFAQGRYDLAVFCGVILGALLAFLWFNIHPAQFIMGDTGAMSLGVTLGIVAMLTNTAFILPIIGMIFVLESLSVLFQIFWRRVFHKKLFLSAPFHHHLEAIGWPESKIVMRLWVVSIVSAALGVAVFLMDVLVS